MNSAGIYVCSKFSRALPRRKCQGYSLVVWGECLHGVRFMNSVGIYAGVF